MSAMVWNCQGLAHPRAIRVLKDMVLKFRPFLVFLCETLATEENKMCSEANWF